MSKKRIIIISAARTGGTFFTTALNSHPLISLVGEPFTPRIIAIRKEQETWISELFETNFSTNESNIVGFRTKIEMIDDLEAFIKQIHTCADGIIFLDRKNIIKKAISRIRATRLFKETGDYNLKSHLKFAIPDDEKISRKLLKRHLQICEEESEAISAFKEQIRLPILVINYEEILDNQELLFQRVYSFLGIEAAPVRSWVLKYTSDDLQKSVPNFQHLVQAFSGHPYESMFWEGSEKPGFLKKITSKLKQVLFFK